jgi:hypothetical protein
LLLGLKGSLNEYELDLLRQRSVEARRAKAQRGELLVAAPVGFVKTDAPHFEKDLDRRIQEAVALVFQKFGELGTVRQTLSWFLEHGLQLPARSVSGEITWRRPSFGVLYRMLSNPIYGGAYTYGKTEHLVRYDHGEPHACYRRRPREEWLAFIPQAHEGYVSWDEFERIRHTMAANLRGILGLLKPDSGVIRIHGERIDTMPEAQMMKVRGDIGMLFQESALFDLLIVAGNVGYRLDEETDMLADQVRRRVEEILGFMSLGSSRSTWIVQSLSSATRAPTAARTGATRAPITPAVTGNSATVRPSC